MERSGPHSWLATGEKCWYHHHIGRTEGLGWNIASPEGFAPARALEFSVHRKKSVGDYRIIILGGSTVEGFGALNPLDNLSSKLDEWIERSAKLLNGYKNFEIINGGVSGYVSAQEFLYFATELIHYEPDLVIFYDGWNDRSFWIPTLTKYPDHPFAKRFDVHIKNYNRLNETYSFPGALSILFQNIYKIIPHLSHSLASMFILKRVIAKTKDADRLYSEVSKDELYKKNVLFYEQNIRDSISLARSNQIKFAHFLQPLIGIDEKEYYGLEKKWADANKNQKGIQLRKIFYKKARLMEKKLKEEFANKPNVCLEDLSTSVKNVNERIYADGGHLNATGNEIMAKNIVNQLSECGILELR